MDKIAHNSFHYCTAHTKEEGEKEAGNKGKELSHVLGEALRPSFKQMYCKRTLLFYAASVRIKIGRGACLSQKNKGQTWD